MGGSGGRRSGSKRFADAFGRLVPDVDDLCSIALDLWAAEQRFSRIEPGLLGI